MSLKNNLQAWREERTGWSQERLAEKLKISTASVSRIEGGTQQPRPKLLAKICKEFGRSEGDFYSSETSVAPAPIGRNRIPIFDLEQAGAPRGATPQPGEVDMFSYVLTNLDYHEGAFGLVLTDDSMAPLHPEGTMVVIDRDVPPVPGDYVLAKNNRSPAVFRQYQGRGLNDAGQEVFELVPLNQVFPPLRSDRQQIEILGVMMEFRGYRPGGYEKRK